MYSNKAMPKLSYNMEINDHLGLIPWRVRQDISDWIKQKKLEDVIVIFFIYDEENQDNEEELEFIRAACDYYTTKGRLTLISYYEKEKHDKPINEMSYDEKIRVIRKMIFKTDKEILDIKSKYQRQRKGFLVRE